MGTSEFVAHDRGLRSSFATCCDEARRWPLPGAGETRVRFGELAQLSRRDLVLGRLVEAHADAVAILAELGGQAPAQGERWGVWAAGRPDEVRAGSSVDDDLALTGERRWCSGATLVTHALVTAEIDHQPVLCAVDLDQPGVVPGQAGWSGGMAAADTRTVCFDAARATAVSHGDAYLSRPGFWAGAVGVAACWYGGAARVATTLWDRLSADHRDPHALAHLGRAHALLDQSWATLSMAADSIDADPRGDHRVTARSARAVVERSATEVIDRVGRALGPDPLAHDEDHARAVADLQVYVRQEHAERDLEALGCDVATRAPWWAGAGGRTAGRP